MLHHRLRAASGARDGGGGGGNFDPMDLRPLVFYDPADITTLWQDSAGTNPITNDGQTVRRIDDKSGNGYHASLGDGLTYNSDGYLAANGTSQSLYVDIPQISYPYIMTGACDSGGLSGHTGSFTVADPTVTNKSTGIQFSSDASGVRGFIYDGALFHQSGIGTAETVGIVSLTARVGNQFATFNKNSDGPNINTTLPSGVSRLAIAALQRSSVGYYGGRNGGFLLFDYDIGDTNRGLCEQWLADRYGVTI